MNRDLTAYTDAFSEAEIEHLQSHIYSLLPLSFHPLSAFYVLTLEDFYLWPTLL